ncbi:lipoprotein [Streptomyces laurentii]|uniref:lipoprotein n=1 Tax=Streptomyces laurentii TaxID=39478 RepID=UPI0036C1810A
MPDRSLRAAVAPAAFALLAAGLLTACGTDTAADTPAARSSATAKAPASAAPATPAVKAAGSLGGPKTACALPISFTLAADWEPKAVEVPEDSEFAELARKGPATMRCEVDVKPAGNIGFLRVWTAPKGTKARAALEGFVGAELKPSDVVYRDVKGGALPAVEVTYALADLDDGTMPRRAFAVDSPQGAVIVHLGGLDAQEHREMLPAYELARTSVTLP